MLRKPVIAAVAMLSSIATAQAQGASKAIGPTGRSSSSSMSRPAAASI